MNQYIITEEELLDTRSYIYHEDEVAFSRIESKVRSCPYKSEREKVLELLRLKYVEFLNHPCPELADKYKHCCDADWCGLCTLDEVLAELRQKAGEQCGDDCQGECSGEVTGTPFCPQPERDKVLDIVADIINNRITELREGKPEYYIRFGEKNTFNELQATEGEFLLLRIREELQQAGEP